MRYALGAAFNVSDIFDYFDLKKLKISQKDCQSKLGINRRSKLVKDMFRECFNEVINDIIDNNVTFELPVGKCKATIYLKRFVDKDFVRLRKKGAFKDVDFLASNFSGYNLMLSMPSVGRDRDKPIYVDNNIKQKIIDNTNQGKQYC